MSNRILAAFDRMQKQIAQRIKDGITTQSAVDKTDKALDMDFLEYVKFQEMKTLAYLEKSLSFDEAQSVYACLGESVETFNNQPVHVKAVLTQLFKELLEARMSGR